MVKIVIPNIDKINTDTKLINNHLHNLKEKELIAKLAKQNEINYNKIADLLKKYSEESQLLTNQIMHKQIITPDVKAQFKEYNNKLALENNRAQEEALKATQERQKMDNLLEFIHKQTKDTQENYNILESFTNTTTNTSTNNEPNNQQNIQELTHKINKVADNVVNNIVNLVQNGLNINKIKKRNTTEKFKDTNENSKTNSYFFIVGLIIIVCVCCYILYNRNKNFFSN